MVRRDHARPSGGTRSTLVDVDQLEKLLITAACARRSLTYAEVLAHFGLRITPRRVYALCRDLGAVCERNRARGEPELAVLVVRKPTGCPAKAFSQLLAGWHVRRTGDRAPAAAFIRRESERSRIGRRGRPPHRVVDHDGRSGSGLAP